MPSSIHKLALVTGATGAIGPTLVRALLQHGYQVRALVRTSPQSGLLPQSVSIFHGDITDPATVNRAAAGCDIIFHLAAKLHVNAPEPSLRPHYELINVRGTQHIVDAAVRTGARRLIFFSTISVYGPTDNGAVFDETTPPKPHTLYAKTKLDAEEIVLATQTADGDPLAVALRLAAVYGPGMKGNYRRLLSALRRGLFVRIGPGQNRRTLVHVEDVARAALLAAESEVSPSRVYNITDGEIHTFQQIIEAMGLALQRRPPAWRLPIFPIRSFLKLSDAGFRLIGRKPPIGEATLDKLLEDIAVSGDKACRELGFAPQMSLMEGWRNTVQAMTEK